MTPMVPKGPVWAAASLGASMTIGVLMAMFHYPNLVLESGEGMQFAPLELGVDFVQPVLFALGMTYLPLNLSWWGNTTLGCYAFHFYFKDTVGNWMISVAPAMSWDPTGLLMFFIALVTALFFTTFLGPVGHAFLVLPHVLPGKIKKFQQAQAQRAQRRQEAREIAPSQPAVAPSLNNTRAGVSLQPGAPAGSSAATSAQR